MAEVVHFNNTGKNKSDRIYSAYKRVDTFMDRVKLLKTKELTTPCWGKIYKTRFLIKNKIVCSRHRIFEDELFTQLIRLSAKSIEWRKDTLIHYNESEFSRTYSIDLKKLLTGFVVCFEIVGESMRYGIRGIILSILITIKILISIYKTYQLSACKGCIRRLLISIRTGMARDIVRLPKK